MRSKKVQQRKRKGIVKARREQRLAKKPTCSVCGKRKYINEAAAIVAISSGRAGYRVYQCEGGSWHTTSHKKYISKGTTA